MVTVDENFTITEAVAVRADKILAVGTSNEVLRLADEATQKIDLKGRTVIPGLLDSHSHFHSYGRNHFREELGTKLPEYPIDWPSVKTKDDVLVQIANSIKKANPPPGELLFFTSPGWASNPTAPADVG